VAVESALDESTKTRMHRAGRWIGGWWVKTTDNFGMGANKAAEFVRKMYNTIDEHYKLTKYYTLREAGMTREMASKTVRLFSQQYQDIPYWLRDMPLKSLVVSFPYELMRLTYNAIAFRPSQFLGLMSVVPTLNLMQVARAGIDWERWMALLDARGNKNPLTAAMAMATNLFVLNPRTGAVESEIDFGGYLPYMDSVVGHGPIAQGLNNLFPAEKRTALESLAIGGASFLGSFVANHPVINIPMAWATGRDPTTGEKYYSDTADPLDRIKIMLRATGEVFVPFGREIGQIYEAGKAPTNPRTQRPYRSQGAATVLLRGLTGLGLRGKAMNEVTYALGLGRQPTGELAGDKDILLDILYKASDWANSRGEKPDYPVFGLEREKRKLYYTAVDSALTEEARARARAELDEFLKSESETSFAGLKAHHTRTDREIALEKQSMEQDGVQSVLQRLPLHAQVFTLLSADWSGLNQKILRDLTITISITNNGSLREYNDPAVVRESIDMIADYLKRKPEASVSIRGLYNHLVSIVQPMADFAWKKEQLLTPAKAQKERAVKEFLRR
jgi:hypothetical protein